MPEPGNATYVGQVSEIQSRTIRFARNQKGKEWICKTNRNSYMQANGDIMRLRAPFFIEKL